MPSDIAVPASRPRAAVPLLIVLTLLGWGTAAAAFLQRDDAVGRAAEAETAKAALTTQLADSQKAAGQATELQQKLDAAQAEVTAGQARLAEGEGHIAMLTHDLAARTQERDALKAQLAEAQAKLAAAPKATPATPAAPPPPLPAPSSKKTK